MDRDKMQIRLAAEHLITRSEEGGDLYLEGYFSVANTQTELWPGAFEEIAPGAFDETLGNDIRALINHDTTLVLGRNKSGTLKLKSDAHGLWGRIKINQKDTDAMNAYHRTERGDISGNSFGFNILAEETHWRDDGSVLWRITKVDLHEVSVCTFPQYEQTTLQARHAEFEQHGTRQLEAKRNELRRKLNVKANHA